MVSRILSVIALGALTSTSAYVILESPATQSQNEFNVFASKYSKQYSTVEYMEREKIYKENVETVKKLNSNPKDSAIYTAMSYFGDKKASELFNSPTMVSTFF